MKDTTVSLFRRANRPDAVGVADVAAVLDGIRSGRWADAVASVRAASSKDDRKRLKLDLLPAAAFSGTFRRRANNALLAHSGLVCLDFDDVEGPPSLRDKLGQHTHVSAAFCSVSGTGVKALVPVEVIDAETGAFRLPADDAEHKAACSEVFALFPLASLDRGCRDVARLCYVSHDADLRVNPGALPVAVELVGEESERLAEVPSFSSRGDGEEDAELVRSALSAIPPRPGYPAWVRVIASVRAAVESDYIAEGLLAAWSPEENPGEYAAKLCNGLDRVGAGTLFWLARQHGWSWPGRRCQTERRTSERQEGRSPCKRLDDEVDALPWRPFPVDTLPGPARDYVIAAAAAVGCDVAAVAMHALAVLAAAVGNSFRIRLKATWMEPSTLWVCVVMPSGSAKSPAWHLALRPVLDLEREAREEHALALEGFEATKRAYDALSKKQKSQQAPPEKPAPKRIRVSDSTVESLAVVHGANPRGLLFARDELAAWIASFDRYTRGGGDMQAWIEMHDGKPVVIDRKTSEIPTLYVDSPSVCATGTSQPSMIRESLTTAHFGSGFAPRLLLCEPPASPRTWTEADVSSDVSAAYDSLVRDLYALPEGGGELALSEAAKPHFVAWVERNGNEMFQLPDGPLRSACAKIEAKAARLALVFALAEALEAGITPEDGFDVSESAIVRAVRLALWLRYETARLYRLYGFERRALSPDACRALDLPEEFAWQDVAEGWGVKKAGAYKVIDRLTKRGYVEDAGHGKYRRLLADGVREGRPVDFGDFGIYTDALVSKVFQSTAFPPSSAPILSDLPAAPSGPEPHAAPSERG